MSMTPEQKKNNLRLALILASCLNMPNLKFRGLLRTAVFLPCVTSLVAYSVLFKSSRHNLNRQIEVSGEKTPAPLD